VKRYTFILIALLSILTFQSQAQSVTSGVQASLDSLFVRIVRSRDDSTKIELNDSVRMIIDAYVLSDSVMGHSFTGIRYLGQITSSDKTLKIINWNLALRDGSNRYYCYVIRPGAKGKPNRTYRMEGADSEDVPGDNKAYSISDWYGGIYYAIQPFRREGKSCYLVLGLNNNNVYVTRKIIDVISFGQNDDIIFGSSCFSRDKKTSSRVVFEYSGEAVVSLRMLNAKTVIFDRLTSIAGDKSKSGDTLGAEYRFDGYSFKKGTWSFISNVDARNNKKMQKTGHKVVTSPY
jgi:hypothetical protein